MSCPSCTRAGVIAAADAKMSSPLASAKMSSPLASAGLGVKVGKAARAPGCGQRAQGCVACKIQRDT